MASTNKYTEEYRRETADYVISTGRPIAEVARELGLNPKTVNRWVLARKGQGAPARAAESAELKKAQKRIRELEMENEFLKKQPPSSQKSKRRRAL